jgi:3-hydroxyisobutyrate dehydrogenase-like beta-hydroxyacid dehydrogenase
MTIAHELDQLMRKLSGKGGSPAKAPRAAVETVGFVGMGKIGLPICAHLLKGGYRVLGYRRGPSPDFEALGGIRAGSPAEIAAEADVVLTCLPTDEALEEVVHGADGLIKAARPGQIVVELGSHDGPVKQRYVGALAAKGAVFLDGEVSGTPTMVVARKGVIYLAGDRDAARRIEPIVQAFADSCLYLGPFGAATTVKLINNLLVGLHIAGTAQAMAIGVHAGVDVDLMIKAIATGSGGSTQFAIRAPLMAERKFLPSMGSAPGLLHYLERAKALAGEVGASTQLLDCVIESYRKALPLVGERDVAALIELFEPAPQRRD